MRSFSVVSVVALAGLATAQTAVWGQCGGTGFTGSKTCVSGACCIFSNEWYSQCQPCSSGSPPPASPPPSSPPPSTPPPSSPPPSSPPPSGGIRYPTAVVKSLPNAVSTVSTNAAITVSGTFDGGMKRYERNPGVCQGQSETGEADAMFILNAGATLANVIIGASQAEGVHCKGTCTLVNVWWADVCEDGATFKQSSGTSQVIGGGAFKAADKIFQFNGRGTLSIKYFYANDYGKLVRSCGNCSGNGGPRNVIVDNSVLINGGVACGINTNYGDTCRISNTCANKGKWCDMYTGNASGAEPTKISSGPNGSTCIASGTSTSC